MQHILSLHECKTCRLDAMCWIPIWIHTILFSVAIFLLVFSFFADDRLDPVFFRSARERLKQQWCTSFNVHDGRWYYVLYILFSSPKLRPKITIILIWSRSPAGARSLVWVGGWGAPTRERKTTPSRRVCVWKHHHRSRCRLHSHRAFTFAIASWKHYRCPSCNDDGYTPIFFFFFT